MEKPNSVNQPTFDTAFLNGLRILLALWVAVGHFYYYIGADKVFPLPILGKVLHHNSSAVSGFMIITGFLMTFHYTLRERKELPEKRETFIKFWLRRFFRLYPIYFIAIIVAFFLLPVTRDFAHANVTFFTGETPHFKWTYDPALSPTFKDLFLHLTFLHGFFPVINASILGPAWSLSPEVQFYVIFPLLYLLFFYSKRSNFLKLPFIVLIAGAFYILSYKLFGDASLVRKARIVDLGLPTLVTYQLIYFVTGMIMAKVLINRAGYFHLFFCSFICICLKVDIFTIGILATILIFMFSEELKDNMPGWAYRILIFFKQLLGGKAGTMGANLSYSLYLIHSFTLQIILFYATKLPAGKPVIVLIAFVAFLVINLLLSYVLYRWVEEPFIAIGKRIVDKKYPAEVKVKYTPAP
jgi:peptidoglycan/LPS O-acetylase OafA/YrhL